MVDGPTGANGCIAWHMRCSHLQEAERLQSYETNNYEPSGGGTLEDGWKGWRQGFSTWRARARARAGADKALA